MKLYKKNITCIIIIIILNCFVPYAANAALKDKPATKTVASVKQTQIIKFKDPELEKVIRGLLSKKEGNIRKQDVLKIKSIDIDDITCFANRRIRLLDGMEYLTNLTFLDLSNNLISDISPLSGLTSLKHLDISNNCVDNISIIKKLKNLEELFISDNWIINVDSLSGLSKLKSLDMHENYVKDISKLNKLSSLELLVIDGNLISDISSIKRMPALDRVDIDNNPVIDISPVKNINNYGEITYANTQSAGKQALAIVQKVITQGMTDLEKAKALHDYLINNVKYDYQCYNTQIPTKTLPYDLYGAISEGYSVCEGYAKTMKVLGQLAGLDVLKITGFAGGVHAWNLIKIDGTYRHIDVTWDDIDQGEPLYRCFNVPNDRMIADHFWDIEFYPSIANSFDNKDTSIITCKVNSEIPEKRDLLVIASISLGYKKSGVDYGIGFKTCAVYPAMANSIDVKFKIPKEIPVDSGTVEYYLSYEIYEIIYNGLIGRESQAYEYKGCFESGGFTRVAPLNGEITKIQSNEPLHLTLLKKGSLGAHYKKAELLNTDKTVLTSDQFGRKYFTIGNDPTVYYKISNCKEVVLPPYSVIYVSYGTMDEDTKKNYDGFNEVLAANHTGSSKVLKAGEIESFTSMLQSEKSDEYVRLIIYIEDFVEKDQLNRDRIMYKGSWLDVKDVK